MVKGAPEIEYGELEPLNAQTSGVPAGWFTHFCKSSRLPETTHAGCADKVDRTTA
jgi:hypothetical protein